MTPDCLSWDVDYPGKTITVTARLAFYYPKGMMEKPPSKTVVTAIKNSIERAWGGLRFKCFRFQVKLEVRAVKDRELITDKELPIELRPQNIRGGVWVKYGPGGNKPLSDDPTHGSRPLRGQWSDADNGYQWPHEFGHVLGLADGYIGDYTSDAHGTPVVPGHARDLMSTRPGVVSAQMVTRLIRRSGQVDESKVTCPLTLSAGPSSINAFIVAITDKRLHAYACDYDPPSDDPARQPRPIRFQGTVSYGGSLLTLKPLVAGAGVPRSAMRDVGDHMVQIADKTTLPVSFELRPFTQSETLVIEYGNGLKLEAEYVWDAKEGKPVLSAPFRWGGFSTVGLFPGPPMEGVFEHGARECQP